jgi:tRNA (guanosine-2'-O-)-methyltransferase
MKRDAPEVFEIAPQERLPATPEFIVEKLSPLLRPERIARMKQVLSHRTSAVLPVLDDIADPHNVAAILRSAEAFGLQHVQLVERDRAFFANKAVTRGSEQWIDVGHFKSVESCATKLKKQGYRIYIAEPAALLTLADLEQRLPIAVVFGNEHRGPSEAWHEFMDGSFQIPMHGFVESLNVSVAAAITFFQTSRNAPRLASNEQTYVLARWLLRSISKAEDILKSRQP